MIELLPYCKTQYQRDLIETVHRLGSISKAADHLGIDVSNACKSAKLVKRAAIKASGPDYANTPQKTHEGGSWNGDTTLYKGGPDEPWALKWIKRKPDQVAKEKALTGFVEALCADITPAKPAQIPKSIKHDPNLMSAIYIGDAHLGMYSYGKETKHSDFNSDIASKGIRDAIDNLVARSPDSETGLLVDVGDSAV